MSGITELSDISTEDRDEMICPNCNTHGLEEHIGYVDEYDGIAELKFATRCPNEDCKYHSRMPKEEVEKQLPDYRFRQYIRMFDLGSVVSLGVMVIVIIGVLELFGFISLFNGDDGAANGDIELTINAHTHDGEYPTFILYDTNEEIVFEEQIEESNETLNIDVEDPSNVHLAAVDYDGVMSPPAQEIDLLDDNVPESLEYQPPSEQEITIDEVIGPTTFELTYQNPANIQDKSATVAPVTSDEDNLIQVGSFNRGVSSFYLPSELVGTVQYQVEPVTVSETFEKSLTYPFDTSFNVFGNENAEDMTLTLDEDDFSLDTVEQTQEIIGESGTISDTVSINEGDNVTVNGRILPSDDQDTQSGTVTDGSIVQLDEITDFNDLDLLVEPTTEESGSTDTGEITETTGTISPQLEGNQEVQGISLEFVGGDVEEPRVEQGDVTIDGESGTITEEYTFDDLEEGEYRIELTRSTLENETLVDESYIHNNQELSVDGEEDFEVTIEEGDQLTYQVTTELETIVDDSESPADSLHDDIEVADVEFTDGSEPVEQISSNDIYSLDITLQNTGNQTVTDTLNVVANDTEIIDETFTLSPQETTTLDINDFGSFNYGDDGRSGLAVFWIGDHQEYLRVDIDERTYGSISVGIDAYRTDLTGTVELPEYDCTVAYDDGQCSIDDSFDPSTTPSISYVMDESIQSAEYEVNYISRENPENITVTADGDQIAEFDGVLENTESTSIDISPDQDMAFSIGNDVQVDYTVLAQSVEIPEIVFDGESIDMSTVQSGQTFEIGEYSEGSYNIQVDSDTGDYILELDWEEPTDDNPYPTAIVNGSTECTSDEFIGDTQCTLTTTQPDEYNIQFEGGNPDQEAFDYEINYTGYASPTSMDILRENIPIATNENPQETPTIADAEDLSLGQQNTLEIQVSEENEIQPDVDVEVYYQYSEVDTSSAEITVERADGEQNTIQIPESGVLTDEETVTLSEEYFRYGTNNIEITTENDGLIDYQMETILSTDETLQIDS